MKEVRIRKKNQHPCWTTYKFCGQKIKVNDKEVGITLDEGWRDVCVYGRYFGYYINNRPIITSLSGQRYDILAHLSTELPANTYLHAKLSKVSPACVITWMSGKSTRCMIWVAGDRRVFTCTFIKEPEVMLALLNAGLWSISECGRLLTLTDLRTVYLFRLAGTNFRQQSEKSTCDDTYINATRRFVYVAELSNVVVKYTRVLITDNGFLAKVVEQ